MVQPPSPAAWLSPPAAVPWLPFAEPSSADLPVTGQEEANLGAPCPCVCQVEEALQASWSWPGACPYLEAWVAWAVEAEEGYLASEEEEIQKTVSRIGGKRLLHDHIWRQ